MLITRLDRNGFDLYIPAWKWMMVPSRGCACSGYFALNNYQGMVKRTLLATVGAQVCCLVAVGQPTFDAGYALGVGYGPGVYAAARDDRQGFWVFKANGSQATAAIHVDSVGTLLEGVEYSGLGMGAPIKAWTLPDSSMFVQTWSGGLRISRSGEALGSFVLSDSNNTMFRIAAGAVSRGTFYRPWMQDVGQWLLGDLSIQRMDLNGNILAQKSFLNDSLHLKIEVAEFAGRNNLLLAGRSFRENTPVLAVVCLDSLLNLKWARTGPQLTINSNVPMLIKTFMDGTFATIWDGNDYSQNGGILHMDTMGNPITFRRHNIGNIGDIAFLPDGGWLFLHGGGLGNGALVSKFNAEGELLSSTRLHGEFWGQLWAGPQPDLWYATNGIWTPTDLTVACFDPDTADCTPLFQWPGWILEDTLSTRPIELVESSFAITSTPASVARSPLPVVRTVYCGTIGIHGPTAGPSPGCTQLPFSGSAFTVKVPSALSSSAELHLTDMWGRELPTTGASWETTTNESSRLLLPATNATAMVVLRILAGERAYTCKLLNMEP